MPIPYLSDEDKAIIRTALEPLNSRCFTDKSRVGDIRKLPEKIQIAYFSSLILHAGVELKYRVYTDVVAGKLEHYLVASNKDGDLVLLVPKKLSDSPRIHALAKDQSTAKWFIRRDIKAAFIFLAMWCMGTFGLMVNYSSVQVPESLPLIPNLPALIFWGSWAAFIISSGTLIYDFGMAGWHSWTHRKTRKIIEERETKEEMARAPNLQTV